MPRPALPAGVAAAPPRGLITVRSMPGLARWRPSASGDAAETTSLAQQPSRCALLERYDFGRVNTLLGRGSFGQARGARVSAQLLARNWRLHVSARDGWPACAGAGRARPRFRRARGRESAGRGRGGAGARRIGLARATTERGGRHAGAPRATHRNAAAQPRRRRVRAAGAASSPPLCRPPLRSRAPMLGRSCFFSHARRAAPHRSRCHASWARCWRSAASCSNWLLIPAS